MPLLVRSPEADILAAYATGFGDYVAEWGPGQAWKWNPQPRTAPVSSQTPDSGALANFNHQPYSPEAALLHIPVDTLGVKALAAGAGLDDAESTYSRFCSVQPDGTQLYCEVSPTTPDTPAQFANIVKGPPAEALWLLIRGGLAARSDFGSELRTAPPQHPRSVFRGITAPSRRPGKRHRYSAYPAGRESTTWDRAQFNRVA